MKFGDSGDNIDGAAQPVSFPRKNTGDTIRRRTIVFGMSEVIERDTKTGQFKLGHTGMGGRPKGARSKLSEQLLLDLSRAWETHGPAVLERLAKEKPAAMLQAMVMLMPKDVNLHTNIGISTEEFAQNFRHALSLIHGEPRIIEQRIGDARQPARR